MVYTYIFIGLNGWRQILPIDLTAKVSILDEASETNQTI